MNWKTTENWARQNPDNTKIKYESSQMNWNTVLVFIYINGQTLYKIDGQVPFKSLASHVCESKDTNIHTRCENLFPAQIMLSKQYLCRIWNCHSYGRINIRRYMRCWWVELSSRHCNEQCLASLKSSCICYSNTKLISVIGGKHRMVHHFWCRILFHVQMIAYGTATNRHSHSNTDTNKKK